MNSLYKRNKFYSKNFISFLWLNYKNNIKGGELLMNSLNKRELVSIRIPIGMNKRLSTHVKQLGISKNAFVLNLLNKELEKEKKGDD